MKKFISGGEGLPRWNAPISHAVVVNGTCYPSGQLSLDRDGNYVPGSAAEEAMRAFSNLFAVLAEAGFSSEDLVFVDIAFTDLGDVEQVNSVFARLFHADRRPARTIYQAAGLPYGARVKVCGVAVLDMTGMAAHAGGAAC